MRKFILIALFFTTTAFAEKQSYFGANWKVGGPYNTTISNNNAIYNQGFSTTVLIAREIYQNGGKFCPTMIFGDYDLNHEPTISYRDNIEFTCTTICKPGFRGEKCENSDKPKYCGSLDYESLFKGKLNATTTNTIIDSNNISAFKSGLENNAYTSVLLAITDYIPHGVKVAPIEVYTLGNNSLKIRANNQNSTLCTTGYELKDGQCIKPADCQQIVMNFGTSPSPNQDNPSPEEDDWCSNWNHTNYDPNIHQTVQVGTRIQHRCKNNGQGFETTDYKKCINCGETKKSGIDSDGLCHRCQTGTIFTGETCTDAVAIPKAKMRECYMANDFENCVRNND